MGIYSSRTRFIQELKIDGKKIENREEDDDIKLDTNEDNELDNNSPEDDNVGGDEEDYKIQDETDEPPTEGDDSGNETDEEDYNIPDEDETPNDSDNEDFTMEDADDTDNETDDAPTEDETPNDEGEIPDESGGGDDDFTMGNTEDETGDETGDETDDTGGENEELVDGAGGKSEIQSLEYKLFSDLTPEQMSIKQIELKQQYIDLFDSISDIVSRVNKITKTTNNANVIEFVTTKMIELKDLVHYYLNNTYNTRTYIENTMNYQQYILILNTINKMLKEIIPKTGESN